MSDCAQGMTSARPRPLAAEKAAACASVALMDTPTVHSDQMSAPVATTTVRSRVSPTTPLRTRVRRLQVPVHRKERRRTMVAAAPECREARGRART